MALSFLDVLTTGGLGTFLGGISGAVSKYYSAKLEFEHKEKEWAHVSEMTRLQMQADAAASEQELLQITTKGELEAFGDSIKAEAALVTLETSVWANNIRVLFRPALTALLWVMVLLLTWLGTEDNALTEVSLLGTINAASLATGYWFGSRYLTGKNK